MSPQKLLTSLTICKACGFCPLENDRYDWLDSSTIDLLKYDCICQSQTVTALVEVSKLLINLIYRTKG